MLKAYKTLVPYAKRYAPHYAAGILFLLITNAGELYIPQLLKEATDTIALGVFDLSSVWQNVVTIIGIAAVVALARFGWRFFIQGASRNIEASLRSRLFDHLLKLSPSFYGRMKTGDIMARATNDMRAIRMASGMALVAFIDGLFLSIAILIILFSTYPTLALITVLPLPLITIIVLFAGKLIGQRFKAVQEGFSALSERVRESIAGIRVIKSFVKESYSEELFRSSNEAYRDQNMKLVRVWGLFFPLVSFISGITILLLFIFGGSGVVDGRFTPGDFVAFMSYLNMLRWPVVGMGFTVNIIQRGAASLTRINAILDEQPEITSAPEASAAEITGDLEIRGLTYRYDASDTPVLQDISFTLPQGRTLGILGRTGSGKTTLVRQLPRLLNPPVGTLLFGGRDINLLDLHRLRSSIAFVPQDTFLFSDTIRGNISFGDPDASDDAVQEAAEISTISRELYQFPLGWDTEVGERGVSLSGGQKQRIAISRAVLLDREYLILDDAMSAVDTDTEEHILTSLLNRRKGKTNILVSHRVSTLQHTDQIIVLDRGRIIQRGSHRDLISTKGLYKDIYELQQAERGSS